MKRLLLILLLFTAALSSIRAETHRPAFDREAPAFNPVQFFTGHTRSLGVFENRRGEPTQPVKTETWGRLINGELHIEQDLYIGNQPRRHRSWRVRQLDARHFEANASDMRGKARGTVRGNTFSWSFTLALQPKNPLLNVRMTQHMYLQPDGQTLINRSVIRKFGFTVAQVTEQFRRD